MKTPKSAAVECVQVRVSQRPTHRQCVRPNVLPCPALPVQWVSPPNQRTPSKLALTRRHSILHKQQSTQLQLTSNLDLV